MKSTVLHCQGVFKNKKIVEKSQEGPLHQPINWGLFLNESKRIMKNQLWLLSLVLAASENFFIQFDLRYHLHGTHVNWKLSFLQKGLKTYKFWSLKGNFEAFQKFQDPPYAPRRQRARICYFCNSVPVLPNNKMLQSVAVYHMSLQTRSMLKIFFSGLFEVFFTKMLIWGRFPQSKKWLWVNQFL